MRLFSFIYSCNCEQVNPSINSLKKIIFVVDLNCGISQKQEYPTKQPFCNCIHETPDFLPYEIENSPYI